MDDKTLVSLLTKFPLVVASLIAAKNYLRFPSELKVISWYVFVSVIVQFLSQYLAAQKINNLYLLHIFVPVSFVFFSVFYQKVFEHFIHRNVLWCILVVFVCLSTFNSVYWQDISSFNSYTLSLESALLIIYSLSLFALFLNESVRKEKKTVLASLLWINAGILMYYASGLLIFYFGDLLMHISKVRFRISWLFHSFIYVVQFTCISIGLWKYQKK
jgi:hypothetical protein